MPMSRGIPSPCAALVLLGFAVLAGCEEASSDCKGNDDCPKGKVCNLLAGVCIADIGRAQDLGFSGSFQCSVNAYDPMASVDLSGLTDVVGGFDGVGIRFDNLLCMHDKSGDGLTLMFMGVTASATAARDIYALSVRVPLETSFVDSELSVQPGLLSGVAPSGRAGVSLGVFADPDVVNDIETDATVLGVGESGEVQLTGETMPGETLAGTMDVRLMAFGDGTIAGAGGRGVGEPCEELTDCDISAGLACLESLGSICAGICETQADCDAVEGVCTFFPGVDSGFCLAPCEEASDCAVAGVSCVETPGSAGPSCADGFISQDHPEALGTPCTEATAAEACPTTVCLTWSGDEGICTLTCETDADCGWYLDVDTTCLPLSSGDRVCLQRCSSDGDCPAHLVCLPEGDENVCVIPRETTMPTDPDASPTLDAAIQRLAEAQCALDAQCNEFLLEIVAGDEAYCVEQVVRMIEYAATLPGNGVKLNNDGCAVLYEGMTCEEWQSRSAICPIAGTLAQGEPCSDSTQCRTGWCQGTTFTCGVCAGRALPGEPCQGDTECFRGDTCSEGKCVRRPGLGEECTATVPCFDWATCLNGFCRANDRQLGQSCGPEVDQPFCELDPAHLVCNANTCVRATVAPAGEPCPTAGWCGESGTCVNGTCVTGGGPNDLCSETQLCRWPFVCFEGHCLDVPSSDACEG